MSKSTKNSRPVSKKDGIAPTTTASSSRVVGRRPEGWQGCHSRFGCGQPWAPQHAEGHPGKDQPRQCMCGLVKPHPRGNSRGSVEDKLCASRIAQPLWVSCWSDTQAPSAKLPAMGCITTGYDIARLGLLRLFPCRCQQNCLQYWCVMHYNASAAIYDAATACGNNVK